VSRAATIHIRLLNVCLMNKAEPVEVISLLAVNAFVSFDYDMLGFWMKIAAMETERRIRFA